MKSYSSREVTKNLKQMGGMKCIARATIINSNIRPKNDA